MEPEIIHYVYMSQRTTHHQITSLRALSRYSVNGEKLYELKFNIKGENEVGWSLETIMFFYNPDTRLFIMQVALRLSVSSPRVSFVELHCGTFHLMATRKFSA